MNHSGTKLELVSYLKKAIASLAVIGRFSSIQGKLKFSSFSHLSQRSYLGLELLKELIPLTKPTISMLVVVTVLPTLFGAKDQWPTLSVVLCSLIGTYLAANSSAVFNHIIDADIDIKMLRTQKRPVPAGIISRHNAMYLGIGLGAISFGILFLGTTPLAAYLSLAANIFYAYLYTAILKRRTDQNIVIGGAAGAVGPLIGWASVTGTLSWSAWVQFLIIFLWTPPHFWALAIKYKNDYHDAGIPMLPVTRGEKATKLQIFLYTLTLIPTIASLWIFGAAGLIYFCISFGATLYFVFKAWQLKRASPSFSSMQLFIYSCFYLFIVFGSLAIDRIVALINI